MFFSIISIYRIQAEFECYIRKKRKKNRGGDEGQFGEEVKEKKVKGEKGKGATMDRGKG